MGENLIIVFKLGNEVFGIPVTHVNEIVDVTKTYKLPETPDYVLGLVNIRGNIHVIYDLKIRFGLGCRPVDEQAKILLISSKNAGLLVDDVIEIIKVGSDDVDETSDLPVSYDNRYVSSFVKYNGRIIIVLSIDEILKMA